MLLNINSISSKEDEDMVQLWKSQLVGGWKCQFRRIVLQQFIESLLKQPFSPIIVKFIDSDIKSRLIKASKHFWLKEQVINMEPSCPIFCNEICQMKMILSHAKQLRHKGKIKFV